MLGQIKLCRWKREMPLNSLFRSFSSTVYEGFFSFCKRFYFSLHACLVCDCRGRCRQRSGEGVGSSGPGIVSRCELLDFGCWELNLGPLRDPQVLFIAEPTQQWWLLKVCDRESRLSVNCIPGLHVGIIWFWIEGLHAHGFVTPCSSGKHWFSESRRSAKALAFYYTTREDCAPWRSNQSHPEWVSV